jgi:PST family polysaccharide transporter
MLPKFISNNLILKITSLNSLVVGARLLMSLVVQKLLAEYTGQSGIAKVGQLRNISSMLMSLTSLGTFNGVVKYVSEYKRLLMMSILPNFEEKLVISQY